MDFKICQELEECRALWNAFSPNKKLFDVWDFRIGFYDENDNEPYFIVGYENKKPEGIVPLSFVKSKKQYTYFGGWFPERNSFFLKDKTNLPKFLEECPNNTFIEGIEPSESRYYSFPEDEYTYFLDLGRYNNEFGAYFSSLDRKRQKNFNRDLKSLPDYTIHTNRLEDFDRLVELNVKQYEEDSKFNSMPIRNGIRNMADVAHKKGILDMVSIEINGRIEAVDMCIVFGEWYHSVIGGANNQRIPNLGKLMTMLDIKNAIAKKAKFVDFFATSGYWKGIWNFDKEMLLKFAK